MKWTKGPPTQAGFYWVVFSGVVAQPCLVEAYLSASGTSRGVRLMGTDEDYSDWLDENVWWLGPLQIPDAP